MNIKSTKPSNHVGSEELGEFKKEDLDFLNSISGMYKDRVKMLSQALIEQADSEEIKKELLRVGVDPEKVKEEFAEITEDILNVMNGEEPSGKFGLRIVEED